MSVWAVGGIEIDATLENIEMNGISRIGSCRNALQQVLFSLGAYATCSRSNKILIHKAELSEDIVTPDYELTAAEKGVSQSVDLKPLVTSLDLSYFTYTYDPLTFISTGIYLNFNKLFEGSLQLGEYIIDLYPDIPYEFVGSSVPTPTAVVDFGDYLFVGRRTYMKFECTTAGTWNQYANGLFRRKEFVHNVVLSGAVDKNRITIKNGSFISSHNREDIADELFTYFQERYVQKVRLYATAIKPGDSVLVDTYDGKQIQGIVEKVKTDLARGFISDVEIVGVLL